MPKVAICDDNEDFTKRIEEHTEHFSHENNIDVKVSRFISGPQLMLSYFYKKYDIIFLLLLYFVVHFIIFQIYRNVYKLKQKIFWENLCYIEKLN